MKITDPALKEDISYLLDGFDACCDVLDILQTEMQDYKRELKDARKYWRDYFFGKPKSKTKKNTTKRVA